MPRTSPMADAARRMPAPCSSAASAAVAGVGRDLGGGDAERRERGRQVRDHRDHEDPLGPRDRVGDRGGDRGQRHGQAGQELELGVGLDQLAVVAHHGRDDGAARHGVGLAHRQHRERLREEQQALEVVDHHEAHERRARP